MEFKGLIDLLTLLVAIILKLVVVGVMLVKTSRWTWLGRGFLLLFAVLALAFVNSLIWKVVGVEQPDVTYFGIRGLFILNCLVILESLRRYEWPDGADGIQWRNLLGLTDDTGETP